MLLKLFSVCATRRGGGGGGGGGLEDARPSQGSYSESPRYKIHNNNNINKIKTYKSNTIQCLGNSNEQLHLQGNIHSWTREEERGGGGCGEESRLRSAERHHRYHRYHRAPFLPLLLRSELLCFGGQHTQCENSSKTSSSNRT